MYRIFQIAAVVLFALVVLGLKFTLDAIENVLRPLEWSGLAIWLLICGMGVTIFYLIARLIDRAEARSQPQEPAESIDPQSCQPPQRLRFDGSKYRPVR